MYELEYVRKRKRRKIVALVGGVSAVVVTSLAIVSFLGRFVGTFTVSLETRNVDLTLSERPDFAEYSSFLRVKELPPFQEFTYSNFAKYEDVIDTGEASYLLGANYAVGSTQEVESLQFFKYTFYIRNVGSTPANYDLSLNIKDDVKSTDGRSLLDTMRVMIYKDGDKTVFGKRQSKPHIDEEGNADYRSPISIDLADATETYPFQGYAEMFKSDEVVTTYTSQQINIDEIQRFTIVTWLEGFRSSSDKEAPKGATIKLGVEINAYESQ